APCLHVLSASAYPRELPSFPTRRSSDLEVFRLMAERGVALCPTLAAVDAILQYGGWRKASEPPPERMQLKHAAFRAALDAGVTICNGSDVGVYPHGTNARELELMVEAGM